MLDTLELLRPKLLAARSYEEACREAESLDKYFKSKLGTSYCTLGFYQMKYCEHV
jgi:hypothetical protein